MAFKSFRLSTAADQKKTEEEQLKARWLKTEQSRTQREKYEVKEISGWMYVGPFLGLLVAVIAGLMIWMTGAEEAEGLWWIVGIAIAPLLVFGFASNLEDEWKASIDAKEEVGSNKPEPEDTEFTYEPTRTLNGFKYKYDYLYTDSYLYYALYKLAKFVMGLSTIVFGLMAAILLFVWLGSISIAPTTIIIILLIIIIMNQNRDRRD